MNITNEFTNSQQVVSNHINRTYFTLASNGLSFKINEAITLDEIKSTILQYLGVPNYSSFNAFKTPVTIPFMNNVTGSNVYRWNNLKITIEVHYNESETDFQVNITHNGIEEFYKFDCKDTSVYGYFGFLDQLTNLLEF